MDVTLKYLSGLSSPILLPVKYIVFIFVVVVVAAAAAAAAVAS
jgi:hypothetical protein